MSDLPTDPVTAVSGGSIAPHSASASEAQTPEGEAAFAAAGAEPAASAGVAMEPASAPAAGALNGRVTRVTAEQVFVTLEDGRTGAVPLIEFSGQPLPKEGDGVSVIIERTDERSGFLALSKRQADELTFWQSVQPGDELEGVVTGMNKGGLDIDIGGARAFLPASHVDTRRLRDISTLIGEHVRCAVTQVDRTTHDLIVSRRKIIEKERKQKRAEMLDSLVEGEIRTGTVSNLAEFGAFIDLGGVDGLLHITDMSWGRINDPTEVVQKGQELAVRVLKVDRQHGKVSLGLKQVEPNPWEGIENRYTEASRIKGRVVRLADFGAFIELEPGVDALLPASEMSWSRRIGHPSDMVRIGDELELVVLKVDPHKRRISVGRKQMEENPWTNATTEFPVNAVVHGKVSKLVDFGAFVELRPGIEGMIHISELSEQRVRTVADVVSEGQEVDVRILKIDSEAQRISLSMRPQREPVAAVRADGRPEKPKKPARKKPLRGGLSSHFEW